MHKGNLDNVLVIGDKILVKPLSQNNKLESGLLIPPGVQTKEKVQKGFVIKTGPGYPISMDEEEYWKEDHKKIKYVPLQIEVGDLVLFLLNQTIEVSYNKEKYYILSQTGVLLVERDFE